MKTRSLILLPLLLGASLPAPAADQGAALWARKVPAEQGPDRWCGSCHTDNLRQHGRHAKSGKTIDPLAPSANPMRLTDPAEVEKWFGRNCRWTWGRECTADEKEALLRFIASQ